MSLWLAKPVYELLPYFYMVLGAVLMIVGWQWQSPVWPMALLSVGGLLLLAGLVIWLRRRDYRTTQAEYNSRSLDE